MVLVEALAAGTPVVAPASCGPAEIVDPIVRPPLPARRRAGAARALVEVLGDPERARALGAGGRERARARLLAGRLARAATRELIARSLASGRRRRRRRAGPGAATWRSSPSSTTPRTELRALLARSSATCPARRWSSSTPGSTDGGAGRGPRVARRRGDGRSTWAATSGFGARVERGRRGRRPAGHGPDQPRRRAARRARWPTWPPRPRGPTRPSGCWRRSSCGSDGKRQDSAQLEPGSPPLGAAARRVPPALMPPPLARAGRPVAGDEPRAVGWAVGACVAARAPRRCAGSARSTRARSCTPRTSTWACARPTPASRPGSGPTARVLHHGGHSTRKAFGGEPFELLARRRREVVRKWRGARRQEVDDAFQLVDVRQPDGDQGAAGPLGAPRAPAARGAAARPARGPAALAARRRSRPTRVTAPAC